VQAHPHTSLKTNNPPDPKEEWEGIRGHATLCLHVRDEHGEDFIVKDCWTHQGRKVTKEQVLLKLKKHDINGLPILKEAWTVQIGGWDDTTDLC